MNRIDQTRDTTLPASLPIEASHFLIAEKKIQRLMLRFWINPEKREQLDQDLSYMQKHVLSPQIEKLLSQYLKKQWPLIDSVLKARDRENRTKVKLNDFFHSIKNAYTEKTFVITEKTETFCGRRQPHVKVAFRADTVTTIPLHLIALPNEEIEKNTPLLQPVKDQQDANTLVKILSQIDELAWDYKDEGCYTRAILACQLLEYTGVPRDHIQKIEARGSLSWSTKADRVPLRSRQWSSHIAPIVSSENRTCYVIDPSINSERALFVDEWKSLLGSVKTLEQSPSTNTLKSIGKDAIDRELELSKASFTGYKRMYTYRLLSKTPFHSQTRVFIKDFFDSKL